MQGLFCGFAEFWCFLQSNCVTWEKSIQVADMTMARFYFFYFPIPLHKGAIGIEGWLFEMREDVFEGIEIGLGIRLACFRC